jgi:hypothetical protein
MTGERHHLNEWAGCDGPAPAPPQNLTFTPARASQPVVSASRVIGFTRSGSSMKL